MDALGFVEIDQIVKVDIINKTQFDLITTTRSYHLQTVGKGVTSKKNHIELN
jgi:hypothetical protein